MFFLGCQKSNLDEAKPMKTSASRDAGVWWNAFRDNLVQIQKKINKLFDKIIKKLDESHA